MAFGEMTTGGGGEAREGQQEGDKARGCAGEKWRLVVMIRLRIQSTHCTGDGMHTLREKSSNHET